MVRAASWGDGRNFHQSQHRLGFWPWPRTLATTQVENAINRRLTKPRFPQGSEISITGCPKFVTAEKSGLTNPVTKAATGRPELRQWRLVSAFPRSWLRALSSGQELAGVSTACC